MNDITKADVLHYTLQTLNWISHFLGLSIFI